VDCHIRAHLGAQGARGAFLQILGANLGREKSLLVDLVAHVDELVGAGNGTQGAPFAARFVDKDFGHDSASFPAMDIAVKNNRLMLSDFKNKSQSKTPVTQLLAMT
jgi:hypothetical protein